VIHDPHHWFRSRMRRWRAQAAVAFVLAGIVAAVWLVVQVVRWIGGLW